MLMRSIPEEASAVALGNGVLAVATWSGKILLYRVPDFTSPTALTEDAYATSLSIQGGLLAGLSNGCLAAYDLDGSGRKLSTLGTRPLQLHPIDWSGDEQILAVGLAERMSVIFGSRERVDFSSISRKVSHP